MFTALPTIFSSEFLEKSTTYEWCLFSPEVPYRWYANSQRGWSFQKVQMKGGEKEICGLRAFQNAGSSPGGAQF